MLLARSLFHGPRSRGIVLFFAILLLSWSNTRVEAQEFGAVQLGAEPVPSVPTLLTPLNGSSDAPMVVALRWAASTDASRYNVEVATDPALANKVFQENVPGTQVMFTAPNQGTTYWWRVNAEGEGGQSGFTTPFSFTTVVLTPGVPVLLTPINGATGVAWAVQLRWTEVESATRYNVEVATDAQMTTKILQQNVPANHLAFTAPLADATYWWRVYAEGPAGDSPYSATFRFTASAVPIPAGVLAAPVLLTPLDGSADVPTTTPLRWSPVAGATRYNVEVATDAGFTATVFHENTPGSQVSFDAPEQGRTYWWRVWAESPGGNSAYSAPFSFTTELLTPDPPELLTPLNGATAVFTTVALRWRTVPNATRYNVEVATDAELVDKILQENVPGGQITFEAPEQGKTYWWRVYAEGPGGRSAYSSRFHFTTVIFTTGMPQVVSPADLSVDQPNRLDLMWTPADNAQQYVVKVFSDPAREHEIFSLTTSGTTTTFNAPIAGDTYYWQVQAIGLGGGVSSVPCSFTTSKTAGVLVAHSLKPADGSTGVPVDPTLSWAAPDPDSTDHYRIHVATDADFANLLVDQDDVKSLSVKLSGLMRETAYYWRVGGVDAAGRMTLSPSQVFTTVVAAPAAVQLVSPVDGGQGVSTTEQLRWGAVSGSDRYEVQIAKDVAFTDIFDSDSTVTGVTFNAAEPYSYSTTYFWRVRARNDGGWGEWSSTWSFTAATGTASETDELPVDFALGQNYPNPFNPTTKIEYSVPEPSDVRITVFDALGRPVAVIVNDRKAAGFHSVDWSGTSLSSGVYYYRMDASNFADTRQMTLLK